jgi:hydroxymethylbilane synthase
MKSIRIATRGSKLAMTQSNYVKSLLQELDPELEITLEQISTKGDRDKSDFLYKTESVGFFTSEVENALLDGRADLAVHSLKDLPTAITEGLIVAANPKREMVADAMVTNIDVSSLADLPAGATVGTSSLRRIAQVKHINPSLECVPLRGNVETRVRKVREGQIDAAIIACAGLNRMDMSDVISAALDPEEFIPAPGQGALAIQVRADDEELNELVAKLDDKETRIRVETERAILAEMHGGCSIPLGVHSMIENDTITLIAVIAEESGEKYLRLTKQAPIAGAIALAKEMAAELLASGAREILDSIRQTRDND